MANPAHNLRDIIIDMPSNKTKVSIIIPVYNVEKYLDKCLQSVTGQTLKDIEIFLIDDGSSDKSWKIVQAFAKRDKRITAIQQQNAGAAVARNRGLELANGEYIGFVDSDDYVDADYFEKLYAQAVKEDADIARAYVKAEIETGKNYQINHSTEGYNHFYNVNSRRKVEANKLNLTSSNWLAVYRRSILEENNIRFIPEIRTGQDNIFNLHASYFANKVVFVEEPSYYHMIRRDGSLMTGYNFTAEGLISRALVIAETVRFLSTVEDYDPEVYAFRIKDVLEFFHSRLIKMNVDKETLQRLVDILIPVWKQVRHKDEVRLRLRHHGRFVSALDDESKLRRYITYIVPIRRRASQVEKRRQSVTGVIRGNKAAYAVLRPPVHVARKVNKLVEKLLS